jgi:YVTN family beta-propeller protein
LKIRLRLLALANLRATSLLTLSGTLAMVLGMMTWPNEALAWTGQPLAYVSSNDGILVIDTGDNKVVDTISGPSSPTAVAPDGKHVYAFGPSTSDLVLNISVINAANDEVVASIPLDGTLAGAVAFQNPSALAVTPDGSHLYVTTEFCPFPAFACHPEAAYFAVWAIDTSTHKTVLISTGKGIADGIAFSPDGKYTYLAEYDPYYGLPQVMVVETGSSILLPGNNAIQAIAITPDGKHLYVPYLPNVDTLQLYVAVIDTGTNTVVQSVLGSPGPTGPIANQIAVTPDGQYVFVPAGSNDVAVIATASNTIIKTVAVGSTPIGVAVTPDGAHLYVANQGSNSVSVINTANDTVADTVPVAGPSYISIIPPPQGVPFLSFNARLDIDLDREPTQDAFGLGSSFTLSSTASNEIHPDTEPVKLQVGPFIATIPAGSFKRRWDRSYTFEGVINNVRLEARIELRGGFRYAFHAEAKGANLSGATNPVQVSLGIGDHAGLTSVKADFVRDHQAHHWTDD